MTAVMMVRVQIITNNIANHGIDDVVLVGTELIATTTVVIMTPTAQSIITATAVKTRGIADMTRTFRRRTLM